MSYFDGIAAPLLILSAILRTHLFTIFSHYNSLHYHMVTGGTVAFFLWIRLLSQHGLYPTLIYES